jgi:tetratricopeptide (TPR) repeat protein
MQKNKSLSDIEVFKNLQEHVNKHPQDIQSQVLLGAMMFEPFHKTDQAIEILEKAIETEPHNADAHFWLAKCFYHDYVDAERAKEILLKALKLDAKRADCLSLMASVITDLGLSVKERLAYLEQAVQQAPDWITPRQYLAQTLMELGNIEKAELEVMTALSFVDAKTSIQPSNPVEEYYESAVTGRIWPNIKEELTQLLQSIRTKRQSMPIVHSDETAPMTIIIVGTPDKLVAKLWCENEQWAEISQEQGELKLEIYPKPNGHAWHLKYDEAVKVIQEAKAKLLEPNQVSLSRHTHYEHSIAAA